MVPAAIDSAGSDIADALVFDLDAHAESADSEKPNVWLLGSIGALILLIAVTLLLAGIPRKNDMLASDEEYKRRY